MRARVFVFPRRSAVYFFASVAFFFFSADNKESGNGSLAPATNPSRALIATNSCHFELRGLHFFVSLASWFIFWWWPTSACLAVEAQMQQLDEGRVFKKKNWNAKKKKKASEALHPSHWVWFDLFFSRLLATALLSACRLFSHSLSQMTPRTGHECPIQNAFKPVPPSAVWTLRCGGFAWLTEEV